MFADVYRVAAERGIASEVIDRTPLWKVGAMLRPAKTAQDETLEVFEAYARGEEIETRPVRMADVLPFVQQANPNVKIPGEAK